MKLTAHSMTWSAMIVLLASAALGQEVKTDYDRSASFGEYRTYSWQNVKTRDPLIVDRIKSAVNAALAAKGWKEVQSGGDAVITISKHWTRSTTVSAAAGVGVALGDSASPRQQSRTTRWGLWLLTYSTRIARS